MMWKNKGSVASVELKTVNGISSFPQMKPEKKAVEMTEEEKVVLNQLKENSPLDLNELKGQTGLIVLRASSNVTITAYESTSLTVN